MGNMSNIEKYYRAFTSNRLTVVQWGNNSKTPTEYTGYIQPVSGGEVFKDGKAGEQVTHRLYTAVSVDFQYGDVITQDSQNYYVVYSDQVGGITNRQHHKEILLSRSI
jgi:hypothetical protein